MSRLAARADHVAGDDRLPVAGCERVRSAPEHRDEERDEHEADAQLLLGDERREAALARRRRSTRGLGRAVERRRHTGLGSRLERRLRARHLERALEQILRDRRAADRSSSLPAPSLTVTLASRSARITISFQPTRPLDVESAIVELPRSRRRAGIEDELEAGRLQAADALRERQPPLELAERQPLAGRPRRRGRARRRPASRLAYPRDRAARASSDPGTSGSRRDRGREDVEPVARDDELGVAVRREVAERMGLGGGGSEERGKTGDENEDALHATAFRATGAQRIEKCGLRSSARPNHVLAAAAVAETPLDHPAVEVEGRVALPEPQRALGSDPRLGAAAVARRAPRRARRRPPPKAERRGPRGRAGATRAGGSRGRSGRAPSRDPSRRRSRPRSARSRRPRRTARAPPRADRRRRGDRRAGRRDAGGESPRSPGAGARSPSSCARGHARPGRARRVPARSRGRRRARA